MVFVSSNLMFKMASKCNIDEVLPGVRPQVEDSCNVPFQRTYMCYIDFIQA